MGNVLSKHNWPFSARSKTGWFGCWQRKFSQNARKIASSRFQWGFFSPTKMCVWFPSSKNCAQSRSRKTGTEKPQPVFSSVLGIGKASSYLPTKREWQSLSAFCSEHLASLKRPPDLEAAAFPTSSTKPLAARTAAAHVASAREEKEDLI